jgi:hypothetical protein
MHLSHRNVLDLHPDSVTEQDRRRRVEQPRPLPASARLRLAQVVLHHAAMLQVRLANDDVAKAHIRLRTAGHAPADADEQGESQGGELGRGARGNGGGGLRARLARGQAGHHDVVIGDAAQRVERGVGVVVPEAVVLLIEQHLRGRQLDGQRADPADGVVAHLQAAPAHVWGRV